MEDLLRRYGAEGYSVANDFAGGRILVQFRIPDSANPGAAIIPVRIPVEVQRIYHALYGVPMKYDYTRGARVHDPNGYDSKLMEKAERVAWRNLILWVEAQLSAATIGLQTVTEAFYAHAVIGPSGERAIDYVPSLVDSSRMLGAGKP